MSKSKSGSKGTSYRSAISGRYVKPGYAKTHPNTTVGERKSKKSN